MEETAYSKLYLLPAMEQLGGLFQLALNGENLSISKWEKIFKENKYSDLFEIGYPSVICGASPIENLDKYFNIKINPNLTNENPDKYYWAGYALAFIQYHMNLSFKSLFNLISLNELIMLYPKFHEIDLLHLLDEYKKKMKSSDSKLKLMRMKVGLSQSQLADLSQVNIRTIRAYEQRTCDINNAQVNVLKRLSRVLFCDIKDFLD